MRRDACATSRVFRRSELRGAVADEFLDVLEPAVVVGHRGRHLHRRGHHPLLLRWHEGKSGSVSGALGLLGITKEQLGCWSGRALWWCQMSQFDGAIHSLELPKELLRGLRSRERGCDRQRQGQWRLHVLRYVRDVFVDIKLRFLL